MSSIANITSTPADQTASFLNPTTPTTTGGQQTLGISDFLKLITTQLTEQDPLQPMEDTQFISQMASFTSLQQMQTLSKDFETFTSDQKSLSAPDYLGKQVTVSTSSGNISGTVSAITFANGSPLLTVNGVNYDPANIVSISTGTPSTGTP
jgi:flagellar basal-body rod modification protein FlgD